MNILIIGNGFDLNHGLPTKYGDFLEFVKNIRRTAEDYNGTIGYLASQMSQTMDKRVKEYIATASFDSSQNYELVVMKNLISKNVWVEYFIEQTNYDEKGWIDFESEIANVIKCLDYMKKIRGKRDLNNYDLKAYEVEKSIVKKIVDYENEKISMQGGKFKIELQDISDDDYYKYIIEKLLNDLNNLVKCLEIYLVYSIGQENIKEISPDIKDLEIHKVLSFNYTDTYKKIYAFNNDEIEYDFIHGKIGEITNFDFGVENNNMVLGIDEYLQDKARDEEIDFIGFKKYFQRIYKETSCKYKKWVLDMEKNESGEEKNHIYIFGHSLDVTDKDILKELIESKNTITTIFYYDKKVYAKQISNLVKVLGYENLISRIQKVDRTIIFKQQFRNDDEAL